MTNGNGKYTCPCGANLAETVNAAVEELEKNLKGRKTVDAKIKRTIRGKCPKCCNGFEGTKPPRRGHWKLSFELSTARVRKTRRGNSKKQ